MENDVTSSMYNLNPDRRFRRSRRNFSTIKLLTGQVAFRIVCHVSVVGGLIGKAGSVISSISADTECGIHCQEVVPGSDHRVVIVVGSGSIDRKIVLSVSDVGEERREVSRAQEAVVRVFERVWEVEAEIQREVEGDDEAYCGLLADKTHIGAVIGRGGRHVTRIRRATGAKIRMLPPPFCAAKDDELIQITGSTLAAKKALISVTSYLQNCPPVGKDLGLSTGPVDMVQQGDFPDPHRELFPELYSFFPPSTGNSVNNVSKFQSSSTYADREPSLDTKGTQQEVAFRLICSNNAAGGIIGKRGAIVRDLENQSGALIKFAAPFIGSSERVVTVSALEKPDKWDSPAQNAVSLVFARSVEVDHQKGFSSGMSKDAIVTAKLLVGSELVNCLTANGDKVVSDIINKTGVDIQILRAEQVLVVSENDSVVQIIGKYQNVQNALFQVTSRLRQNLLSIDVLNEVEMRSCNGRVWETTPPGLHQSLPPYPDSKQETFSTREVHQYKLSSNKDGPASTKSHQQNKGRGHTTATTNGEFRTAFAGNSELQSGKKPVFVAHTTIEIVIAENVFGCVYGEDGSNLAHLKQISGAKVQVCDPSPGKSEGMVIVSGTPDQILVAQSLLQAFVQSGQ